MTTRKKIVLSIVLAVVVLLITFSFFPQPLLMLETRVIWRKYPSIYARPGPITDTRQSEARGARLSYFGYTLEVPWEVDASRTKATPDFHVVAFTSGNTMLIANPPPGYIARSILGPTDPQRQIMRAVLGESVLGSDFLLQQEIYNVTPSDVKLFASKKNDVARMLLLLVKSFSSGVDTGIFTIQNAAFRGFQSGDPAKRPRAILLQLFSKDGELVITLSQKTEGPSPAISQADLNLIIATLQRAGERVSR